MPSSPAHLTSPKAHPHPPATRADWRASVTRPAEDAASAFETELAALRPPRDADKRDARRPLPARSDRAAMAQRPAREGKDWPEKGSSGTEAEPSDCRTITAQADAPGGTEPDGVAETTQGVEPATPTDAEAPAIWLDGQPFDPAMPPQADVTAAPTPAGVEKPATAEVPLPDASTPAVQAGSPRAATSAAQSPATPEAHAAEAHAAGTTPPSGPSRPVATTTDAPVTPGEKASSAQNDTPAIATQRQPHEAEQPSPLPTHQPTLAPPSPPLTAFHASATTPPPMTPQVPTPALAAPVAIPDLPATITAMRQGDMRRFEIRLDPAELGRIEVRLDLGDDGTVRTHLIVERPETLQMLRQDAQTLQGALADAGLKPDSGGISMSLRDSGGQQNADANGRQDGQQNARHEAQRHNPYATRPAEDAPPGYRAALSPASGLDLTL